MDLKNENLTNEQPNADLDKVVKAGKQKGRNKTIVFIIAIIAVITVGIVVVPKIARELSLSQGYSKAKSLFEDEKYEEAAAAFEKLGGYKDADEMVNESKYSQAMDLYESKNYIDSEAMFEALGDYKNASEMITDSKYSQGMLLFESEDFEGAVEIFKELKDYKNAALMTNKSKHSQAIILYENGSYTEAIDILASIQNYEPAKDSLNMIQYQYAKTLLDHEDYIAALDHFKKCTDYKDTISILDSVAADLIAQEKYDLGLSYLYLHSDNEEEKKEVYYDYLVWQMKNYEYSKTAETFNKIRDYKDVSTNDLFVGAKLLSAKKISFSDTEVSGYIYITVTTVLVDLSLTPEVLTLNFSGISADIYSVSDPVTTESSWKYRFNGRDILYLNDSGEYIVGGTVGKFSPPKGEERKETVTLTFDFPGFMSFTNTDFEIEE